jgi:hypothetical protein
MKRQLEHSRLMANSLWDNLVALSSLGAVGVIVLYLVIGR